MSTDTFLSTLQKLKPRDHLCLIYETQEEQFGAAIPYISSGLQQNERCIYIADENTAGQVIAEMGRQGVDTDAAIDSGALIVAGKRDSYLKPGHFDPDWMLSFLQESTEAAKNDGFTALRVTGEMTWALGDVLGADRLIEYENKLNTFFPHYDCSAICQYNINRFSPEIIRNVIFTHPMVIYGNFVCKNYYYIPPEDFHEQMQAHRDVPRLLNNIRERERIDSELRESSEFNRTLLDCSPNPILVINGDTSIRYANRAFEALTGFSASDSMQAKAPYPWWTPETLEKTRKDLKQSMQSGAVKVEECFRKKNGERFWVEITATVIQKQGRFDYYLANWSDITGRKRAEQTLQESELKFRLVTDTIKDVFWMRTCGINEMIYTSPAYEQLWERSRASLMESPGSFLEAIHPDYLDSYVAVIDTCHKKGKPYEYEYPLIRKNGDIRWIHEKGYPVDLELNGRRLMAGVCSDITEQKKAYSELEEKSIQLEDANVALRVVLDRREEDKNQLIKQILRNIQELVVPNIQSLQQTQLDKRQKTYVDIIASNLEDIHTSFAGSVQSGLEKLSPGELRLANYIRQGMKTKEIADLMGLSTHTVDAYRKNIRKKLGLKNKNDNLQTFLRTLD